MTDMNTIPELMNGPFKIVCGDDTVKNYPQIPGPPPFFTKIFVNDPHPGKYEEWTLGEFGLRNVGTGYWACARNDQVEGSSEPNPQTSKWIFEGVGDNKYRILPVGPLRVFWTAREAEPGAPKTLFLEPAGDPAAQTFSFVGLD